MPNSFNWIPFYRAIANALQAYSHKRPKLFDLIKDLAQTNPLMHYLHFENQEFWQERHNQIDPFTVMGIFNRAATAEHRHQLAQQLAELFDINLIAPTVFHGIAHLDPRRSIYNGNDPIWNLFESAVIGKKGDTFESAYTAASSVKGNALATLSIALFWVNPESYMPLDTISIPYIERQYGVNPLNEKCTGQEYLDYLTNLDQKLGNDSLRYPKLAFEAWKFNNS